MQTKNYESGNEVYKMKTKAKWILLICRMREWKIYVIIRYKNSAFTVNGGNVLHIKNIRIKSKFKPGNIGLFFAIYLIYSWNIIRNNRIKLLSFVFQQILSVFFSSAVGSISSKVIAYNVVTMKLKQYHKIGSSYLLN